jgi:hypothetical protein
MRRVRFPAATGLTPGGSPGAGPAPDVLHDASSPAAICQAAIRKDQRIDET